MRRRKSLNSLQRLAEFAADAASRGIGQRLGALRTEEERLRQVDGFLSQYDNLSGSATPGLTIGELRGRRQFASRLRSAADSQRQTVDECARRYREQVENWRGARAQVLALQRYNERMRELDNEARDRREQARLDEIARRQR